MSKKFNFELDNKLLTLVKKHPFLYDVRDPLYCRKDLKDRKYEEIATALDESLTGAEVRARLSNIKGTFNKNLKLVQGSKRSGISTDNLFRPRWPLYDAAGFLAAAPEAVPSTSNLSVCEDSFYMSLEEMRPASPPPMFYDSSTSEPSPPIALPSPSPAPPTPSPTALFGKRGQKRKAEDQGINDIVNILKDSSDKLNTQLDSVHHFGETFKCLLRQLDPHLQVSVALECLNLVHNKIEH